jgi:hypothetical protein
MNGTALLENLTRGLSKGAKTEIGVGVTGALACWWQSVVSLEYDVDSTKIARSCRVALTFEIGMRLACRWDERPRHPQRNIVQSWKDKPSWTHREIIIIWPSWTRKLFQGGGVTFC